MRFPRRLPLGVAHRLHRGDPPGNPSRPGAGQQHRQQGKHRGKQEYPGRNADCGVPPSHSGGGHGDGNRRGTNAVAQQQAHRNAQSAQQQRLLADQPPQLLRRDADGFEQPVVADVPRHGDLENVVDHQISREGHQNQHGEHGEDSSHAKGVPNLGGGIAPVDADAKLPRLLADAVAAVLADSGQVVFNVQGASQHDAQIRAEGL